MASHSYFPGFPASFSLTCLLFIILYPSSSGGGIQTLFDLLPGRLIIEVRQSVASQSGEKSVELPDEIFYGDNSVLPMAGIEEPGK
jgi:hypothetical protein